MCVLYPLLKGFPLEMGTGAGVQKTRVIGTGPSNKFHDIFSRMDAIHQRDRQMDGMVWYGMVWYSRV